MQSPIPLSSMSICDPTGQQQILISPDDLFLIDPAITCIVDYE